ncbi:MAG: acetyl-CoA carboxylase biotin carboxyl carrier protein subunit [Clostridia bacterium]|nr:acetyl-CoA carboxylase biotin carboxyl carrier protein subunit [Clostridia bacterium]
MKKYKVNVNGTDYEIKLEVLEDDGKTAAPAPKAAPAPAPAAAPAGGTQVKSPMPGTILDVRVSEGQSVESGDVLMILEAMKMENEIVAPSAGKVTSVSVTKGTAVESGTVLCTLG